MQPTWWASPFLHLSSLCHLASSSQAHWGEEKIWAMSQSTIQTLCQLVSGSVLSTCCDLRLDILGKLPSTYT